MADANEKPKFSIEVKSCKTWEKDGIKLLRKSGYSLQKAREIMQSLPYTLMFDTEEERYEVLKNICGEFSVEVNGGWEGIACQPESKFGHLLGYGTFITGFGWLLVIGGVIVFLLGASQGNAFTALVGGLGSLISGFAYIVIGKAISCFISVEKNTRQTTNVLNLLMFKVRSKI